MPSSPAWLAAAVLSGAMHVCPLPAQEPQGAGTGSEGNPVAAPEKKVPLARTTSTAGEREAKEDARSTGFVRFDHSIVPSRVPAGGTGTMSVLMLFEGNACMLSPPPVKFFVLPSQGSLVVGTPKFRPAGPAKLAPALKGMTAYDHYATFDVPFSVPAGTPVGAERLAVSLSYELHDGKTGGLLRRCSDEIVANVVIGPATAAATTAPGTGPGPTGADRRPADARNDGALEPRHQPDAGAAGGSIGVVDEPAATDDAEPAAPTPAVEMSPWPIAALATLLLAALALAAFRLRPQRDVSARSR